MANVSAEILADLMSELQEGITIRDFITENDLQSTTNPRELRQQFITNFGLEALRNVMQSSMAKRMTRRWTQVAERMDSVERVDQMINALSGAIINLELRKSELQSSSTS